MDTSAISSIRQSNGNSDRRWVVVLEDGSITTLNRAQNPSEAEIAVVGEEIGRGGLGGWLAVQSRTLHATPFPTFMEVRRIGGPTGTFSAAIEIVRRRSS